MTPPTVTATIDTASLLSETSKHVEARRRSLAVKVNQTERDC